MLSRHVNARSLRSLGKGSVVPFGPLAFPELELAMRCLRTAPIVTAPIPRRTFQSFGALRNLPCATRRSVRSIFGGRIDLCVSNKVGARASGPHLALLLDVLGKMRAGGPRSNLQRLVRMRRIDHGVHVSRPSGAAAQSRDLGANALRAVIPWVPDRTPAFAGAVSGKRVLCFERSAGIGPTRTLATHATRVV